MIVLTQIKACDVIIVFVYSYYHHQWYYTNIGRYACYRNFKMQDDKYIILKKCSYGRVNYRRMYARDVYWLKLKYGNVLYVCPATLAALSMHAYFYANAEFQQKCQSISECIASFIDQTNGGHSSKTPLRKICILAENVAIYH